MKVTLILLLSILFLSRNLTFSIFSDNEAVASVTESLRFTVSRSKIGPALYDWNIPKTVEVIAKSRGNATISHQVSSSDTDYDSISVPDVDVVVGVSDPQPTQPSVLVTSVENLETSEAGGTATFNMSLATLPDDDVTVTPSSSNTSEGVVSGPLTFTPSNWNTPQSVTVTGQDDTEIDGRSDYEITFSASSSDQDYNNIVVTALSITNTDNDIADICLRSEKIKEFLLAGASAPNACEDAESEDENVSDPALATLQAIQEDLKTITIVDLESRGIDTLKADDFSGFSNLIRLDLKNNNLTSLPARIFSGLSKLQYLVLSDNELMSLPAEVFSGLSELKDLYLNYNSELRGLPSGVFSGLSKLEELDLGGKKITIIGQLKFNSKGFPVNIRPEQLIRKNNNFISLPTRIFSGLSSLISFDLSYNAFTSLPAGIFSKLSNNELTGLLPNTLHGFNQIRFIDLDNNLLQSGVIVDPTILTIDNESSGSTYYTIALTSPPLRK